MQSLSSDDPDRDSFAPALLGVVVGHVLRRRRAGRPVEPANIVAAVFVTARPASRIGGWLADEADVADSDQPTRAVLAFAAGLTLVYVADRLRTKVPRLSRYAP